MQAAKAAGMHAIGVTTGSADADALYQAGADEVVASLVELEQRVSRWAAPSARGA
jgi:phosphoglycolate phosphatase-like HAD superfamily hydrolase